MNDNTVISPSEKNVVFGHEYRQTRDAQWLCLDDIYQKLHRPNYYDIGGTYIDDVAEYWFTYKTEKNVNNFLLHLFIKNNYEGCFCVALSSTNYITLNNKHNSATLSTHLKEYQFEKVREKSFKYITTYCLSDLDVETLNNKNLFIAVAFRKSHEKGLSKEVIEIFKAKHDFGVLLSDPIDTDFTIESEDGEKFKVHRALLSAHSDYFKAMLKEDTAESQNGHVKLIGVSGEDLKCILEFVYTGAVKGIENQNCYNLLLLADSYNLEGLRVLIQHVLILQMNVDNAIEVLSIADMCNCECLKLAAFKFIKKNIMVLQTPAYKELNNAALIKEICKFVASDSWLPCFATPG